MGHQNGATDTDSEKNRPVSAEKIEYEKVSHTHIHVTDICSIFDSESISIRKGGPTGFL